MVCYSWQASVKFRISFFNLAGERGRDTTGEGTFVNDSVGHMIADSEKVEPILTSACKPKKMSVV